MKYVFLKVRVLPESLDTNTKAGKPPQKVVFPAITKTDVLCQEDGFQAVFVVFVIQKRYGTA
jgi:hypothetical protein